MATPRKTTTGPRPVDSAKVHLNLDTYEGERGVEEPFAFVIEGRRIVLLNPRDVAWQDLAELDDPYALAEICMTEEDGNFFIEQRMPARKLEALMQAFQKHYGLGSRGNARA